MKKESLMTRVAGDSLLEVQGVSIDYPGYGKKIRAVDNVSFSVIRGERFVIMGRSGCGKSTLLKAVGGFVSATEGSIQLNGQRVHKTGPDRMVVWQDLEQLLPWKTVEENVAYPLMMLGAPKVQALDQAREWLVTVGLGNNFTQYPHQLSGGMKQRVAIARGFAANPEVLLMDEPFSALDALTRHQLQDELIALQEKSAVTVLFVSHDVNEAVRLATNILVLSPHPGRVVARFPAQEPHLKEKILDMIFDGKERSGYEEGGHNV